METIQVDKYRRSDGTPVKTHKRHLSQSSRLKLGKDFFKKDGDDENDLLEKRVIYKKKDNDDNFNVSKNISEKKLKERIESNDKKSQKKVHKVMKEFKEGKLKSSSGRKVKSRSQAVAIAMSEAGINKLKKKLTKRKALALAKEEKKTSVEYKALGFPKLANDEARHSKVFSKEAKKF